MEASSCRSAWELAPDEPEAPDTLLNAAYCNESRGIWRSGYRTGSDQSFKPDILRSSLCDGNSQRTHQLTSIFFVGKKTAGSFRAFLLKTLQGQNATIMGSIGQQRNGRVVLPLRSDPPQAFVFRLLSRQRIFVDEYFDAFTDDGFALAEIQLVLQQRYPRIRSRASNEDVIVVIEVAHAQISRIPHGDLRLQWSSHLIERNNIGNVREGGQRGIGNVLA